MKLRVAAAMAAMGAPLLLVAACAAPRAALGTTRSPCFADLPIAAQAVSHQGTFAGVARYTLPDPTRLPRRLEGRQPATTVAPSVPASPSTPSTTLPRRAVCLVAFRGDFDPSLIPLLRTAEPNPRYAIVIVTIRGRVPVAVYLRTSLPKPFTHL